MMRNCRRCHECGAELQRVLDGEEWCPGCQAYKRYKSHGWGSSGTGEWECTAPISGALWRISEWGRKRQPRIVGYVVGSEHETPAIRRGCPT